VTHLVFLHGVSGGHAAWDRQVAHFGKLGHRCTAWDQPGYGATPMVDPYTLENIAAALKTQIGDQEVVLVGHSMGGLIAQEFYARHQQSVSALALCFTSAAFAAGADFVNHFINARLGPLDQGKTMAQIAADLMPTMQGRVSDAANLELAQDIMAGVPPETYRKAVRLVTTFDRREDLAKISVPTLLVAGSDDLTAPALMMGNMAQKIPGAEFVVLRGCGHLGPIDQPDEFNKVLEGFLRRRKL
jgi:pimeloyl-ACP methyl ester carboxylesterase